MPSTYLALLRGINVGGKNKLPMKDLIELFVEAGCSDVSTYIQSGNVVFNTTCSVSERLPALIGAKIAKRLGYNTPVMLRTADQMSRVVHGNPFLKSGAPETELHVIFLAEAPKAPLVKTLDPDRSPPDKFEVRGQEIYLHLPNGVAPSKLTNNYFDSKLATCSTGRNWRTVTKLLELMQA